MVAAVTSETAAAKGARGRSATFRSFGQRNYRLYFSGQIVSMAGTFMQNVAQGWLVLKLTGSGTALGLIAMLQYLPMLLFGAMAGVFIDRVDRRRLYMLTQSLAGATALLLGALTATGAIRVWTVYVLAAVLGMITCVDQPLKSAILYDIVGPADLTNAVGLNSAMANAARIVGPALAGITISAFGIAPCFLINAGSFVAVIAALALMRVSELHAVPRQPRARRQVRDGLKMARNIPELWALLILSAMYFAFGWSWDVVMPLMAKYSFHGGAGLYGLFLSALGVGSILGALATARRADPTRRLLVSAGVGVAVLGTAASLAPTLAREFVSLFVLGIATSCFITTINARLQVHTPSEIRGRVMAMWMIAVVGTRPIGAPIVGAVGQHLGARYALAMGGASLVLALPLWSYLSTRTKRGDTVTTPALAAAART